MLLDGTLLTAPRDEVGTLASSGLHDSAVAGLYRRLEDHGFAKALKQAQTYYYDEA